MSAPLLWCALVASLTAICVSSWVALRHRQNHKHPALNRRLLALETEIAVLTDEMSKVLRLVQKRANREAVAAHRARKAQGNGELSDEEWVKQTNMQLTLGRK